MPRKFRPAMYMKKKEPNQEALFFIFIKFMRDIVLGKSAI